MTALRMAIDEVLDLDMTTLTDAAVRDQFIELRACAERMELACARVAAAVEGRGIADADGAVSTPAWIQHHTGQLRCEARASMHTGLALDGFPLVEAAWTAGDITGSAARQIIAGRRAGAEAAYAETEATLVDFATHREYRSLRRAISHYHARVDDHRPPAEPDGLFLSQIGTRWAINGTLDEATGLFVDAALQAAMRAPSCDDMCTPGQRRAEALGLIAKTFTDAGNGEIEHTNAPHVGVHLDWATLVASVPWATAGLNGQPISRQLLERLLCESNITRIITGPDSEILDVGRTRRTPTRAQRKAVIARDQHCRFPGCDRPAGWSEIHHVHPWQHGGPTNLDNLVLLCTHHHHVVHRPGWIVKFDGTHLTIITPQGHEHHSHPPKRRRE